MPSETLVTGGGGLVGTALKKIYPQAAYLTRQDGDLRDLCKVREIFTRFGPRNVIHLAAKVAGVKTNSEKNADMFTLNAQINTNVLNVAQEVGVQKLVTVLSNCVFQENPEKPPTEKDIHAMDVFGEIHEKSDPPLLTDRASVMGDAERKLLEKALLDSGGNVTKASKLLQMSRDSFYRKMKKYAMTR